MKQADLANTTASMQESKGKKVPDHFKWSSYRIKAASGEYGDLAKRAAVDDMLWGRFTAWEKQGINITEDLLKLHVDFGLALEELKTAESAEEEEYKFKELRAMFR